MRRTSRHLAALVAAAALLGAAGSAGARMSILYDTADALDALTGPQPDGGVGLGAADGAFQQQPAPLVLPGSRHAWKVSGGAGSSSTPSVLGRDAQGVAALLRDRIRRSGGHMVFLDELTKAFRGPDGQALAGALEILSGEPSSWGGGTLARRVHIYVPTSPWLLADPAGWASAWRAMALSGGVWLQAYRGPLPPTQWADEEWLTWPRAFGERLAAAGGDPARLHMVLTTGDQERQWRLARTGGSCPVLANGPGAYRVSPDETAFVASFRAAFGTAPAPADGPSPIACDPAPLLAPDRAAALAQVMSEADAGLPPGSVAVEPPQVAAGRRTTVTVRLGADPLGLATALGADPAAFWASAGARLRIAGGGVGTSVRIGPGGTVSFSLLPVAPGPVALTVQVGAAPVRTAFGTPIDLPGSLAPFAGAMPTMRARITSSPLGWRLDVPLATAGGPALSVVPLGALPTVPARLSLGIAGAATARRLRVNPRRGLVVIARVTTADGRPVPGAPLVARLPNGRGVRTGTDLRGVARIAVPRRSGRLVVIVARTRLRAERRISGPLPLPRGTRPRQPNG